MPFDSHGSSAGQRTQPAQLSFPAFVPVGTQAAITRYERFRIPGKFGDMWAPQLAAILWKLDQGYLDSWYDLCEFIISSDATIASLYESRKSRVEQAEWVVKPNKFGDREAAQKAANLCSELIGRCENWHEATKHLLHAIFPGTAFAEMMWDQDKSSDTIFVREFKLLHGHRFRFDEQWQPRLWDQGMVGLQQKGADPIYGLVLRPDKFVVHTHQLVSGYPNVAGIMRPAAHTWLFKRWIEKYYVQNTERHGMPFIYANVPENTPEPTMLDIKTNLENLLGDHAAVMKYNGKFEVIETQGSTSGQSMQSVYLDRADRTLAKLFLGTSDAVDPGANGSNAAVNTRAGATMDPRMVADGRALGSTLQRNVFKWFLQFNLHHFGGKMPPIPTYEAKTASDEVKTDLQALQQQSGGRVPEVTSGGDLSKTLQEGQPAAATGDDAAPTPTAAAQPATPGTDLKIADTAMNGAQISSLIDVLKTAAAGELPRQTCSEIIQRGFNMDPAAVEKIMGPIGNGWTPPSSESPQSSGPPQFSVGAATDPKARRRPARRSAKQIELTHTSSARAKTSPTSTPSMTILAEMLRGASVDHQR